METIWPMMLAVLGANLLTISFICGILCLRNVKRDEDAKGLAILAFVLPLFFTSAGFYLYG